MLKIFVHCFLSKIQSTWCTKPIQTTFSHFCLAYLPLYLTTFSSCILLILSRYSTLGVFQYTTWLFALLCFPQSPSTGYFVLFLLDSGSSVQQPWLLALIFGYLNLGQKPLLCDFISSFRSLNHSPHYSGLQPNFCVSLCKLFKNGIVFFHTAWCSDIVRSVFFPRSFWCYSKISIISNQKNVWPFLRLLSL